MNLSLEIHGVSRLQSLAARFSSRIAERVGQETLESAQRIERTAKSLAPVDTGRLRASIEAVREGRTSAVLRVGAPYGAFVEYGTRWNRAQPFLRPAVEIERAGMTARFGEIVREELAAGAR
ncbi:MAG TPA: HK97-gp10 family putative phage morphogenesis protein [Anaeromyxobacteraceae bacterium]|nr:HK97-gp10 family putative phage morphogenesis protein [Anaeromyxobacteraceae bacterium]